MDKIKEQASIVSQLLFSADTGDIYKKTLARTWDILREVAILLWLVICLTFVGGEWFYRTAVGLGRSTRTWYIGLSEKDPSAAPASMASTGQALLNTVQSSTAYLLSQARQQLGIPESEPKPSVAAEPPAQPAPVVAPVAPPPAPEPPVSAPEATASAVPPTADADADADLA
ncbi:hypothetical protein IQ254_02325 [Nodosilinea sp. LEGE 07088]|uniref:hypothetical protein n=1 Tax=Nodosilinea sp. LEGE 07088 TaxID=2777968 RepID=UPI00187F2754|nr:hypothetical protein [Nodosilinea sp. LEGE 07088]MBE9136048.1 hypothetical protein [Nodosilinea sp. LEGE 07088]